MASLKRKRLNSSSDERAANTVQSLCAGGSSRVQVGNSYTEVHNHEGRQADDECLRDLRTTDPRTDKTRIENDKGGLMQGSCNWILEDSNFRRWKQGTDERLLWVKGDPGKGKTMSLCGLIKELDGESDHTLTYFFCQATDSRINNATSVLRGLIYLLVDQKPPLKRHARTKWNHGGKSTFDPPNGWHVLCNMLNDILRDHSEPTRLVIDALDECEIGSLSLLLDLIVSTASRFRHVRWLVSSRNLPNIERGLGGANTSSRLDISLEANAEPVSKAVADYIGYNVGKLAHLHSDTELRKELQGTMQDKANGTFLWAALVFEKLKDEEEEELENDRDILEVLNQVPQGLSNLYARMWTQIISLPSTSRNLEWCKKILATMFLARRPLQLPELALLADCKGNIAKYDTLVRLVRRCGSFLSIQQGTETVHFVHQSAKDFLRDNKDALDRMFPSGMEESHHQLFSRSVEAMDAGLRQDIYGLRNPGFLTSGIEKPVPDPLAAMRYSCVYWLDHFFEWVSPEDQDGAKKVARGQEGAKKVATFLQERYLYWLKALGLCGNVNEGVASIRELEILAEDNQWGPLATLFPDAQRFALANKRGIETAPLQVYVSALIFCPTSSWIREKFEGLIPEWIKKEPGMQPKWDACQLTLEGHGCLVNRIAFSPDSRIMASSGWDGVIKIWDTYTGRCLNSTSGNGAQIVELAFLSAESSTILASAEREAGGCSIKIWDSSNGSTPLRTFPMPNQMSDVITFITGSKTAVWVDMAGTLIKFDLDTGKPLEEIKLPFMPIAVSPDGQTIITYAAHEHRYQVWDWCNPETARVTLDDLFPDKFHPVVISSDSTKLVGCRRGSSYGSLCIEVWDLTKGTCIASLCDSNITRYGLAYSPNGMMVAFVGVQGTVSLWHTKTDTVEEFSGHRDTIFVLAISPDGRRLASGSRDKTIKVWYATIRVSSISDAGSNPAPLDWLPSPDGLWVACMKTPGSIQMWKTGTGKYAFNLPKPLPKQASNLVDHVEFSPCGRWLACRRRHSVRIWDTSHTTTWKSQDLVRPPPALVRLFSLSSSNLALLFHEEKTVEIWDLHAYKLKSTFSSYLCKDADLMSFSPNGRWLALSSWERYEVWNWDVKERILGGYVSLGRNPWHPTHDSLLCTRYSSYCIQGSAGSYSIDKVQLDKEDDERPVQMTKDSEWVTVQGRPVLWVSPQYRPRFIYPHQSGDVNRGAVDCNKSGIALLDNCSRVIYIHFDVPEIVLKF